MVDRGDSESDRTLQAGKPAIEHLVITPIIAAAASKNPWTRSTNSN
jgi:hypothetical protein